jgi:hypothetical protein
LDEPEDYDIFAQEAHRIIDQLVTQSLAHVNDTDRISDQENEESPIQRGRFIQLENEAKTQEQSSVHWPTVGEFTSEKIGLAKINEYIEKVIRLNLILLIVFLQRNGKHQQVVPMIVGYMQLIFLNENPLNSMIYTYIE